MATHVSTPPIQRTPRSWSLRRLSVIAFGGLLALLVVIQVIPYGHSHINPAVASEPAWDSPQTRTLFFRACGDCHSNETAWPWYTNVAPVSWLTTRDVVEGRHALNVSEWGQKKNKADEAAKTVRNGEMPPWFYLPLHPTAKLTDAEQQQLIKGLTATFGSEEGRENGTHTDND